MTAGNGKPCARCGTCEWDSRGNCRECARTRTARWRRDNPTGYQDWKAENQDGIRARMRKYRQENQDRIKRQKRKYEQDNIEKVRAAKRRNYASDPERHRGYQRKSKRNNPESVRAANQRRRARKKDSTGSFTAAEWKALCKQYNHRCLACGKKAKLTVDHVVPLDLGGSNNIDNIQPLCLACNSRKHNKHIDYRTKPGIKHWIQKKLFG